MSDILEIMTKLQDTNAAIAQAERGVVRLPQSKALRASIESLHKRFEKLNTEFLKSASEEYLDVLSYRFISGQARRFSAAAIGSVLRDFQSLLSVTYDSAKTGEPKLRGRVSETSMKESELNVGYCFSGSFGFMFTVPNERLLAIQSFLDDAVEAIFGLIQSKNALAVSEFARRFGVAPVRLAYKLATDHVEGDISVDIRWIRGDQDRASLRMQTQEFQYLKSIIDTISDEDETEFFCDGILRGGDTTTKIFHFIASDGNDYRGRFDESFAPTGELTLDRGYRARIRKTTVTHYAIEREDETFYLISLE